MENDFININVTNEKELIALVDHINTDIEFANNTRTVVDKEKTLDLNYILKKYRAIKDKDDIKSFREKHDCRYCLYYERPRKCFERMHCPLANGEHFDKDEVIVKPKCSKDEEGNCPYGNENGTCFGFCLQEIVKNFNKEERNNGKQQH